MSAAHALVRIESLRKTYRGARAPALDGVSATIAPGERVAVTGQRLGNEAVVRRIGGGGEETAVQPDHVLLVVVLVLVAAARGDLDDDVDGVACRLAHRDASGSGGGARKASSRGLMIPTALPSGSVTTA